MQIELRLGFLKVTIAPEQWIEYGLAFAFFEDFFQTGGQSQDSTGTGCLPIFDDQFKTFFKTFSDHLFWNLRPVCTANDEQVSDPFPGARIFLTTCNDINPRFFKTF